MRKVAALCASLPIIAFTTSCGRGSVDFQPETIIAMERAALDRWGKGDPKGYLETYAPDVTYFDPTQEKRVNGLEAMKALLLPITGKVKVDGYEMIDPKVQRQGDVAVLTYNLVSQVKLGTATMNVRWNCTEVYGRVDGQWKIIHNHWSFTKPDLKQFSAD